MNRSSSFEFKRLEVSAQYEINKCRQNLNKSRQFAVLSSVIRNDNANYPLPRRLFTSLALKSRQRALCLRYGGHSGGLSAQDLLLLSAAACAPRFGQRGKSVSLRDFYVDGILPPGSIQSQVDEKIVFRPYSASLSEVLEVIGSGSPERERLAEHLGGFVGWMPSTHDAGWTLWVRGSLVADLSVKDPGELDLVVLGTPTIGPNLWPFSLLSAAPLNLHPGRLTVTPIWETNGGFDTDREAVRSSKRCQNENGEQITTGWIQITESEVP